MADYDLSKIPLLDDIVEGKTDSTATGTHKPYGSFSQRQKKTKVTPEISKETSNTTKPQTKKSSTGKPLTEPFIQPLAEPPKPTNKINKSQDFLLDDSPRKPIDVDVVTKQIMQQLMPKLEKYMRFLIRETLEKNLNKKTKSNQRSNQASSPYRPK